MSQLLETNCSLKCQPSLLPNPQGVRGRRQLKFQTTVEPVYNGPILSGHPLLSGQFLSPDFSCIQTLYLSP